MAAHDRFTNGSCWLAATPEREAFAPLAKETRADVAIIGGGLVGLSTALMLQRAGRSVVLLEAGRVGRGVTGGSTAKVTSQHGLIYRHLEARHGAEAASRYARSNEAGRTWIAEQVTALGIDCDFETCPACVYTESSEQSDAIEREVEAAVRAGLPASLVRDDVGLPFPVRAAVRFDGQAQFHPIRYLEGLAAELIARGGIVHEATRVLDVHAGQPCRVETEHGKIGADEVVIATNLPILDRGGFFARAFPYRHMGLAAPIDPSRAPAGMYISTDSPTRSFRSAPWSSTERLLVLIGEAFPTGKADTAERLDALEAFGRERFGIASARYAWGNQDYYAADRIPFVGPILPGMTRIRVATGFNAWGITTGTVAAMILADGMLGRDNDWAELYDSRRLGLRGASALVNKNMAAARNWLAEKLDVPGERTPAGIRPGEAAVFRMRGKTTAAYRSPEGVLHAFDARCTHMGCRVHWNRAERSWDCPCHGSRFDFEGRVLNGPAVRGLRPVGTESDP